MANKEARDDINNNPQESNLGKNQNQTIEVARRRRAFTRQCILNSIKKWPAPIVDSNRDLNAKIGREQNEL